METGSTQFASKVANRAFLLFIGCALIPISVLTFFSIRQVTTELRDQSQRRLRQASKAMGLELHRRLLSLDAALGQPENTENLPDGLRRRFLGTERVAKDGMRQTLTGKLDKFPVFTPEQASHLATGQPVLMVEPGALKQTRFFLARAADPDHPDGAILRGEIDPGYIWTTEDESMLDRGTFLTVLNESGQILFSSSRAPVASIETVARVRKGAAGQFTWSADNDEYLASYWSLFLKNKFLEPKWIIVLNRETNDIFAPIGAFRRTFLLVSFLSVLVVIWLSSAQIQKILSPLARLQSATTRLAEGRLDTRVEVKSGDEFEDLAGSFNQMAGQLGRQFDALTMRNEITLALSRTEPTPQVMQACMEIIVRHLSLSVAGVWLVRPQRTELDCCAVHRAASGSNSMAETFPIGSAEISRVAAEGRPFATNTLGASGANPGAVASPAAGRPIAFAGHPLLIDGRVHGVTAVYASRPLDGIDLASIASAVGEIAQGIARRNAAEALRGTEEQVRQLQKTEAVGRLAAGIAHDFNNLLTVIMGYSQMLKMDFEKGDPRLDNAQVIEKTAIRASQLTQQLLAFSRKQVLSLAVVNLNGLINDMMSLLHRLIGANIEILFKPTADAPLLKVDRGQIEQVIVNLVVNARDAMPRGGLIVIETAVVEIDDHHAALNPGIVRGKHVMLKVTDNGTGMDAVTQSKIFEPFFTTKEPGKGTGLGLATVVGIVAQSHGSVRVESELGQGTSFIFHFPLTTGQVDEARPIEQGSALGGDETILVVEDEQEVRTLLEKILRARGYHVLSAGRPTDALRITDEYKKPIHLLLTDMVMPEMGGKVLSERIQSLHPETKVVQMSGYTDYGDDITQGAGQSVTFLQKPFAPEAVARVVRNVLDSSRSVST